MAELESDKSVFEFESPCDGTVREIVGRAGDILSSGAPFLRIETTDQSLRHLETKSLNGVVHAPGTKDDPEFPAPIWIRKRRTSMPLLTNTREAAIRSEEPHPGLR